MTAGPEESRAGRPAEGERVGRIEGAVRRVRGRVGAVLGRVRGLERGSVHRRVLSAAMVVAFFTFGAKLVAAGKEVLIARQFGVSDGVDAFNLAFTLPQFAISLIGGSLNAALLPVYVDVRQRQGPAAAERLLSTVMVLTLALLAAAAAIVALGVPVLLPLVSARFTPDKLRVTSGLLYVMVPSIVLSGLSITWTAVLQAHDRFAPAAAAGMAVPLGVVFGLLALGNVLSVQALAIGTVTGYALEAALIARAVRRQGVPLLPRWHGWSPEVRRVAGQFAPMVAGSMVMGMNPVIDSLMASRLDAGSVAALNYGNKLIMFAMGMGSVSLTSAVFPHFARIVSKGDWDELARTIRAYALVVFSITVPIVLGMILFSTPIVRLLYQRGAFTSGDTAIVARIQALYLIQVPFVLTSLLFVRAISATARNGLLMWGNVINFVVNVTGNIVFARYLGAAGIALSTSVVYIVSFLYLGWCTWRQLQSMRAPRRVVALGPDVATVD